MQIKSNSLLDSVVLAVEDFSNEFYPIDISFTESLLATSFASIARRKAERKLGCFAEKGSAGGHHTCLNRWLGWGFVNFHATRTSGAEQFMGLIVMPVTLLLCC